MLADLRSSKDEGQSNFINPGLELLGVGADFDILPELRVSANVNYLRFVNTAPLEFLRHQANIPNAIGYDLSVALHLPAARFAERRAARCRARCSPPAPASRRSTRPAASTPFSGGNFLYSVLFNVILTY